jgi:predicted nucleic acid-binding protein
VTLVVSDTSPLVALQQIDELKILHSLFGEVVIPPAVERELGPGFPRPPWLITRPLAMRAPPLQPTLGAGESEAITLASQDGAQLLLLDDRPARRLAPSLGIPVLGTLGLLIRAKEQGLLAAVKPYIETLLRGGFRASPALVERILAQAGEGEP